MVSFGINSQVVAIEDRLIETPKYITHMTIFRKGIQKEDATQSTIGSILPVNRSGGLAILKILDINR